MEDLRYVTVANMVEYKKTSIYSTYDILENSN